MPKSNFDDIPDIHTLAAEAIDFFDESPVPASEAEQKLLDPESLKQEIQIHHPALEETVNLSFTEADKP